MNRLESLGVNNPVRRVIQRHYELPRLARLGGRLAGGRALEIGCGSGYGTKLILDQMGAASVDAVDPDPAMVARARRRLRRYGDAVRIRRGTAEDLAAALDTPDGAYDAVFGFLVLHHVEDWRAALAEAARVLRPGGRLYFVEVTSAALARPAPPVPRPPGAGPLQRRAVPRGASPPRPRARRPVDDGGGVGLPARGGRAGEPLSRSAPVTLS
ncbi:class I SAM-dependent methyltransferase [Georgenia yuyongxinii]